MKRSSRLAIGLGVAAVIFDLAAVASFFLSDADVQGLASSDSTALTTFSIAGGLCMLAALVAWSWGRE